MFADDTLVLLTWKERDWLSGRGPAISDLEMLKILFDQTVYRSTILRQSSCLLLLVHFIFFTTYRIVYCGTTIVQFVERVTWNGPFSATKTSRNIFFRLKTSSILNKSELRMVYLACPVWNTPIGQHGQSASSSSALNTGQLSGEVRRINDIPYYKMTGDCLLCSSRNMSEYYSLNSFINISPLSCIKVRVVNSDMLKLMFKRTFTSINIPSQLRTV